MDLKKKKLNISFYKRAGFWIKLALIAMAIKFVPEKYKQIVLMFLIGS